MRFRTSGRNWEGREWYLAPSLVVLGRQISALHPAGQPGDGTVASRNHDANSPSSDHRPRPFTGKGIVRAIDAGESRDADPMVHALAESRDPRIAYIIYEGEAIYSWARKGYDAWEWQPYTGANPHDHHFHLSTRRTAAADNDTRPWIIEGDTMPLSDSDIDRIKAAILTIDMPDQDDGDGRRGWTHALKQSWGFSIKAATDAAITRKLVEKMGGQASVALTAADIDAIGAEVADELRDLRWRLDDGG